ncbi:hypothetical protein BH10ACT7_BH10ACT7_04240 [soil metagenome]
MLLTPSRALAGVAAFALLMGSVVLATSPAAALGGTSTFGCEGGGRFTVGVPADVDRVSISAGGGSGATGADGSSRFGKGALVEGTWSVTPGSQVEVVVGCSANGQAGGKGYSDGGRGGNSQQYNNGGGGGGSSYVGLLVDGKTQPLIVAGGGGGGGGAGYANDGGHGTDAGPGTEIDNDYWVAENGWKSRGGGGGGGAGAGGAQGNLSRPGTPGHGGSHWGDWGGAGEGGSNYIGAGVTDMREARGGAPAGSGFVMLTFLERGGNVPVTTSFPCSNGTMQSYTVPSDVYRLEMVAVGGAGSSTYNIAVGGESAYVSGALSVTPGQKLSVVAGCAGRFSEGGAGWGKGGNGGDGPAAAEDLNVYGGGGGGATAILAADGTPLMVAGGGGGVGGSENRTTVDGGPAGRNGAEGYPGNGAGGQGGYRGDANGSAGSNAPTAAAGGGGGGGWRGGQGGFRGAPNGGGGGGGSSYAAPSIQNAFIPMFGGGGHGNGYALILAIVATPPEVVQSAAISAGAESVVVSWSVPRSDGRSGIREYRLIDQASGQVRTYPSAGTYTIDGLVNGRQYAYSLIAVNGVGQSAPVTLTATPRTVPGTPTANPNFGRESVRFDIQPPATTGGAPVTGYRVYELTTGRSWDGPGPSILATGLTPGQEYSFQVVAINEAGESARSSVIKETPRWYPDAPTITAVYPAPGGAEVLFTLGNPWGSLIGSVSVTATPQGGGPVRTATGNPNQALLVSGLTDGVAYTFQMTATNGVGQSPIPSAPYGPVTPSSGPSAPYNMTAAPGAGDGQILLAWSEPTDLKGFGPVLEYKIYDVNGNQVAVTPDGTPTFTMSGLTIGQSYGYAVRARTAGGTGEISGYAFATPVDRPDNDLEQNASTLTWTGALASTSGTTTNATLSAGEIAPVGGNGHTIWYQLSIPAGAGGAVIVDLCDSAVGAVMTVNGDQPNGTEHACPGGGSAPRYILDYSAAGVDLLIQVDSTAAQGDINLRWRPDDAGFRSMSVAPESFMTEPEIEAEPVTEPETEAEAEVETETPEPTVEPASEIDPAPPVAPEPQPDPISTEPPAAPTPADPPAEAPPE